MRASVRRATAFHKAGHVVAAWRKGPRLESATIAPAPDAAGRMVYASPLNRVRLDVDGSNAARLRAEKVAIVCLAGAVTTRDAGAVRTAPRTFASRPSWRCG